ncbi:MAG: NAD(P)(+) transhydrogenase (Re/Si-specific) subunit beta [bacterium]
MPTITNVVYLLSAVLFIFGLKNLSSPRTARRGNLLAMVAMLLAVVVTLLDQRIVSFTHIIIGLIVGSAIGTVAARKVQLTDMPQLVALFNGFGGGASALVACSEYFQISSEPQVNVIVTITLSVFIGVITFTGSLIAFAKLQGLMKGAPITFAGQHLINGLLLAAVIVLAVMLALDPANQTLLLVSLCLAAVLGVTSVIPIGGADMPVVISLLNSYSGLAASATGFVISNNVLIISGALVGASGLILTNIMCVAMNRSLGNVLFAAVGSDGGSATDGQQRSVTRYTAEDAVVMFENAQSVIIVPGYGLAVAQAQHVLQEMAQILMDRGLEVRYAIHPVAGRMPGHMNVLLAEANVPYDLLFEMDAINDDFQNTDVALVIGANDVINPAARHKKNSALYGMPILNVDHARTVMIIKRSLSVGFAGEDNELFYDEKTLMLFGDAKKMVTDIVQVLKS